MNMYFSVPTATFLTLLAAFLWGSWMQVVKHLKKYPVGGLVFWLYSFSLVLVYAVTLIASPFLLPDGLWQALTAAPRANLEILFGGFIMSLGLYVSLTLMSNVGLLLTTAITGAAGSVIGVLTSVMKEGLPNIPNAVALIVIATIIYIIAGQLCNVAAKMRDEDVAEAEGKKDYKAKGKVTAKVIFLALLNVFLTNGWSIGTATGTANNIPPIITAFYMVTGSFLSILIVSLIQFTRKKQWKEVLCIGESKKPILLGLISASCHYGGNLISIYSMPVLSATMSFLYGRTATIWTYFWGLFYGEFKGSKRKTVVVLVVGLLLYFVGTAIIGVITLS